MRQFAGREVAFAELIVREDRIDDLSNDKPDIFRVRLQRDPSRDLTNLRSIAVATSLNCGRSDI